jgi:methionyl-tRNA formyltransferase
MLDGRRLLVWSARLGRDAAPGAAPGAILDASPEGLEVATGAGTLLLEDVQLDGEPAAPAPTLLAKYPGARLD